MTVTQRQTSSLRTIALRRELALVPTVEMPTTGPLPIIETPREQDIQLGTINPALPSHRRHYILASYRAAYLHQSVPVPDGMACIIQVFYDPRQPWRIMGHVSPMGEAS